jgi:hypothetical protein
MKEYPTLADMDISRPEEIRDYSLYSEKEVDVLKIYYKRKEGSLLPRRKVFKFPKRTKPFTESVDNSRTVHEIREPSPAILKAVAELNELLKSKSDTVNSKDQVLRRLDQLESEVKSNVAEIRSLLERL